MRTEFVATDVRRWLMAAGCTEAHDLRSVHLVTSVATKSWGPCCDRALERRRCGWNRTAVEGWIFSQRHGGTEAAEAGVGGSAKRTSHPSHESHSPIRPIRPIRPMSPMSPIRLMSPIVPCAGLEPRLRRPGRSNSRRRRRRWGDDFRWRRRLRRVLCSKLR